MSWDIIALDWNIDKDKLRSWYLEVERQSEHLWFNFTKLDLLKEELQPKEILESEGVAMGKDWTDPGATNLIKYEITQVLKYGATIDQIQLMWPIEREVPLPQKWAAKEELYPELGGSATYKVQKKFMFGYFKELMEKYGHFFYEASIIKHRPGARIAKHIDGPKVEGFPRVRLHIPIITSVESFFCYGEDFERQYILEPGKAYLINSSVPHGTLNGASTRIHLQGKVEYKDII